MVLTQIVAFPALLCVAVCTDDLAIATIWLLAAINILADGWWHHVTPLVEIREDEMIVHHHYLRGVDKLMLPNITGVNTDGKEVFIYAEPRRTPVRVSVDRAASPDLLKEFLGRYLRRDGGQASVRTTK